MFAEAKLEDNTNLTGQTSLEGKTPVANNTTMDNLTPEPMEIHNDTTEDLSPCDMDISSPDWNVGQVSTVLRIKCCSMLSSNDFKSQRTFLRPSCMRLFCNMGIHGL